MLRPLNSFRSYTSECGRAHSIASGDKFSYDHPDRTYLGKTNTTANESHLDTFEATKAAMGDKPVIAVFDVTGPMIFKEVEPSADAILVGFELQKQAYMDMIIGNDEPSGLLPFQMSADMETVETQLEDVPRDCKCYEDECGHVYDFAYGLNFSGLIIDSRTKKYY